MAGLDDYTFEPNLSASSTLPARWYTDPDVLALQVLRLPVDPPDLDDPDGAFGRIRRTMLEARSLRPQPDRDDIVVLQSNGLVIAALAEAGAAMDRPDWVEAARSAADHLSAVHRVTGRWFRSSRGGRVGPGKAVLADLAELACGLLALYQATGDPDLLGDAVPVLDAALNDFADRDAESGGIRGFFDTAADAGPLILRPRDPTDGAAPSGLSAIAHALITAAALTGDPVPNGRRRRGRLRGGPGRPLRAVGGLAPGRRGGARGRAAAGRGGRAGGPRARCAGRGRPATGTRRLGDRGRRAGPARPPAVGASPRGRRRGNRLRLPGIRLRSAGDDGRRPRRSAPRLTPAGVVALS